MRCQSLLLFCERHWRRRWRRFRDDLSVHHSLRRRGDTIGGCGTYAKNAFAGGSYRYPRTYGCGGDLTRIYTNGCVGDRLRGSEGALWNCRHCAAYIPVYISDIGDVGGPVVDDGGVVDVGDGGGIDRCITDVHSVHISPADVI
jgi:hypothetical protein